MKKFNFDLAAGDYDEFYNNATGQLIDDLEKKLIGRFLKKINGKLITELGCGTGHWTSYFSENGFSVLGLDISAKMLEAAVKKNIPDSIFINHDIQQLPFQDNSIENIITIAVIEFAENQDKVFAEVKRVLKPGGCFIIGCLNINSSVGKNKSENEIFRTAEFFSYESLKNQLSNIGTPEISGCVLMNEKGEISDDTAEEDQRIRKGVFLAGFVKKEIL